MRKLLAEIFHEYLQRAPQNFPFAGGRSGFDKYFRIAFAHSHFVRVRVLDDVFRHLGDTRDFRQI